MEWFAVDKAGLAKLLDKRGKSFAIFELVQNAWDTNAREVTVEIAPVDGRPMADVRVTDDDPDGFRNLSHAFTLFAESEKKGDPSKRGRFNLGEKLVLALCERAEIASTTGSVVFDAKGRHPSRYKLQSGSTFTGTMRMTRAELDLVTHEIRSLIPPASSTTSFNGEPLPSRKQVGSFRVSLPTEMADEEGFLRKSMRVTEVTVHEVTEGETPMLYEMGIPVVEMTGGVRWHVNVHQKVPLNLDRDNVNPAYLQTLRVHLANEMAKHFTSEDVKQVWVSQATDDARATSEVVSKVLDERFGKKRAIYDPSDPEANKALMNQGYTVIPGGSLSKGQWDNVRRDNLAQASGKIKPSGVQFGNGPMMKYLDPEKYTPGQKALVEYTLALGQKLSVYLSQVNIVSEITKPYGAWYGDGELTFNMGRLGKDWFEDGIRRKHNELILHEFAHAKVKDHLTHEFSDEVGRLGALLAEVMYRDPGFCFNSGYKV